MHGDRSQPQNQGPPDERTSSDQACGGIRIRRGAYLPHWTREGGVYSVTFRLADSLPASVLRAIVREREGILRRAAAMGRDLSVYERRRLDRLHSERIERYLDAGYGACYLRDPRVASLVRDAIVHFEGERYRLAAWCIMPNHVHVVLRPEPGHALSAVLHSWKSFTAARANQLLGRSGAFWQPESYDHLVRDEEELHRTVEYVRANPRAAGLVDWPWAWPSECARE